MPYEVIVSLRTIALWGGKRYIAVLLIATMLVSTEGLDLCR